MSERPLPVVVVAAALVDDLTSPRRLLAARRSRPITLAGRWEFPGGKVDHGETPEEALHRELVEELGVRVELGRELVAPDPRGWRISDRHVMRLWPAVVTHGTPEPLVEHDALRWLDHGEWFDVPWLDADVPIVEALAVRTAVGRGADDRSR
ncbi:DNA mismatch repair protein MutT [Actinotalea ferrariae CF5-4]|uniref:8-oxo-dGTP diphosphatase n=1 Tax=Actinotalea ferrariae CF5-4 TaxID=948458 RepID=A0A021VRH0_9CELL|nr:NUDIX domain-containing protein [Actinotalea ferrariae]EYR63718.1 DNA mismatch repair protein MutT [Actinotalea ferrariae CF5-4]